MYGGNMTTAAEFNIWAYPEAARSVLASGIPRNVHFKMSHLINKRWTHSQ